MVELIPLLGSAPCQALFLAPVTTVYETIKSQLRYRPYMSGGETGIKHIKLDKLEESDSAERSC